jgi:hypothetical protein
VSIENSKALFKSVKRYFCLRA